MAKALGTYTTLIKPVNDRHFNMLCRLLILSISDNNTNKLYL